jgi:hypothetical protein
MTIGPAPMTRIVEMLVRFGIVLRGFERNPGAAAPPGAF